MSGRTYPASMETVSYCEVAVVIDDRVVICCLPDLDEMKTYVERAETEPVEAVLELLAAQLDPADFDELYATLDHSVLRALAAELFDEVNCRFIAVTSWS